LSLAVQVRVRLERPSARREREFLTATLRSRALHRGFVLPPATPAEYRTFVRRSRSDSRESFLVIEAESCALAGVVNINDIVRDLEQSGRLGYYAFVPWAGRGLICAALKLVIGMAFRELGLHRLEANVQRNNLRSIALVEGLEFEREGTARGFLKIGNRWRDHDRWSLLKNDWSQR
jgi:[ribosomal protein S5]-alanine N-acetyltransferase